MTGINVGTFKRVLGHARGTDKIGETEAAAVTANYLSSVAELVGWVDAQG